MALMGATWLLAGLAGRSAVRSVLQTKVDRLPQQGRTPAYACVAAFLAYAAGAYVLAPKVEAAPARTAAGVHVPRPRWRRLPRGPQSCRICRGCPRSGPRPYRRSIADPGRPVGRSGSGLYPQGKARPGDARASGDLGADFPDRSRNRCKERAISWRGAANEANRFDFHRPSRQGSGFSGSSLDPRRTDLVWSSGTWSSSLVRLQRPSLKFGN